MTSSALCSDCRPQILEGGAVIRRFAVDDATVSLSKSMRGAIQADADDIEAAGGVAYAAHMDTADEAVVGDDVFGSPGASRLFGSC